MFDIFNKKKVEELEGDIRTLYTLFQHLDEDRTFKSFCSNQQEIDVSRLGLYPSSAPYIKKTWEDISSKTVLEMVLKKMGLMISYKPGEKRTIQEISPEFKLVKRGQK